MYFDGYPNLKGVYHPWVQEQLKRDRTITSAFGRKMTYWDFWGNRLLNKAYSFYPQSTVGDLTNKAIINIYNQDAYELEVMLQVHDSIIMQIDEDKIGQGVMDVISECMDIKMVVRNSDPFSIPIDLEIGKNWYELKDYHPFAKFAMKQYNTNNLHILPDNYTIEEVLESFKEHSKCKKK